MVCSLNVGIRNLDIRRALARKLKTALVPSWNLIEWVGYTTRDPIEFEGGKESANLDVF